MVFLLNKYVICNSVSAAIRDCLRYNVSLNRQSNVDFTLAKQSIFKTCTVFVYVMNVTVNCRTLDI